MKQEAAAAGVYHHALMNRDIPRVQIVTVQEILEKSVRLDLPTRVSPLKAAQQGLCSEAAQFAIAAAYLTP